MKHLKPYNENKTMLLQKIKDIKTDIRDICLELSDRGFNIDVRNSLCDQEDHYMRYKNKYAPGEDGIYTIVITRPPNNQFDYYQIKETISRLSHYMSSMGFVSWVSPKFQGYGYYCIKFTRKKVEKIKESKEEDLLPTLKDICLELQDEGFFVKITQQDAENRINDNGGIYKIIISKWKASLQSDRDKSFDFDQISEVVERILDYAKSCNYNIYSEGLLPHGNKPACWKQKTLPELYDTEKIFGLYMRIYKDDTWNNELQKTLSDLSK